MFRIRIFLLTVGLATAAFGQTAIYPTLVRMGAAVGSTTPVTETINLVSSGVGGSSLNYDTSILYFGSAQGWLTITPAQGTTPTKLTLTANPGNLAAGTYTAQVQASIGPQHAGAATIVTFIVAPSSSNTGGLAANPTSLTFFSPNLTAQTFTVSAGPGAADPLSYTMFANPSDSLLLVQSDLTTPSTITVQPLPGLPPGTHTGSVTITAKVTGKSTVIPVTLSVPATNPVATVALIASQSSLTFNYQINSTLNVQQSASVLTDAGEFMNYTATASTSWILVAGASFLTPASSANCFAPGLFYITTDPTGLPAGSNKGTITLSAPGVTPVEIAVTLNISNTPVLNANPSFVSLDAKSATLSANLGVTGSAAILFTTSVSAGWLTVTPATAVASTDGTAPTNLTVGANLTGLPTGTYNGSVTLTGSGGSPTLTIPVQLQVNDTSTTAVPLSTAPTSFSFVGISGTEVPAQNLVIANTTNVPEPFTVSVTSDAGWLSVDRLSGQTPMNARVSVNSAIPGGAYVGSIVITSLQTGDQTTVPVTLKLAARVLSAFPTALIFTQQQVGGAVASQDVKIAANAPSTFQLTHQPDWIKRLSTATLSSPATLTITPDLTGLLPGQYQDNIRFSGPSEVAIPVVLTVAGPPPPTVTPSTISFTWQTGSPAPAAQTIRVDNATGPLGFTALASTSSGLNWLSITPLVGTTPGTISATVNVAQLVPGQQSGSIVVNVQDGAGTSVKIPVTLTVTGTAVLVRDVLNAATLSPASLAPGEIVTLTGFGFGPATALPARPTSAGSYGTVLSGTSVLFDGTPAPLLMVQSEQINAIVPYSVFGRVSSKVQVQSGTNFSIPIEFKVVDAAPGIFTAGAGGRGAAMALNADSTQNSVLNPAPRGSVVVFYLTGEGQTDPPGQDGRVIATDVRTPLLPVTATIGGKPAEVQYAGSGPSLVSGMCQVNVKIPETLDAGTLSVEIQVGGIPSQRSVTIEVR